MKEYGKSWPNVTVNTDHSKVWASPQTKRRGAGGDGQGFLRQRGAHGRPDSGSSQGGDNAVQGSSAARGTDRQGVPEGELGNVIFQTQTY